MQARSLAIVSVAILLVFLPASAHAQDDADEVGADGVERRVEVSSSEESVAISLVPEDRDAADVVQVSFDFGNATLSVAQETEDGELALDARLGPLMEYEDIDGNGSYDPGEPAVSAWGLGEDANGELEGEDVNGTARWAAPTVTNVSRGADDGRRVTLRAEIGEGARLSLGLEALGEHAQLPNTTLSPAGTKGDLTVEGYPFEGNDTRLAMLVSAEASGAREVDRQYGAFRQAEEGVVVTPEGGPAALWFAWRDTATVDGRQAPVETTELRPGVEDIEGSEEGTVDPNVTVRELAFSYPRGDRIVHDVRADVAPGDAPETADAPLAGVALVPAAIAAASALLPRPRG